MKEGEHLACLELAWSKGMRKLVVNPRFSIVTWLGEGDKAAALRHCGIETLSVSITIHLRILPSISPTLPFCSDSHPPNFPFPLAHFRLISLCLSSPLRISFLFSSTQQSRRLVICSPSCGGGRGIRKVGNKSQQSLSHRSILRDNEGKRKAEEKEGGKSNLSCL